MVPQVVLAHDAFRELALERSLRLQCQVFPGIMKVLQSFLLLFRVGLLPSSERTSVFVSVKYFSLYLLRILICFLCLDFLEY